MVGVLLEAGIAYPSRGFGGPYCSSFCVFGLPDFVMCLVYPILPIFSGFSILDCPFGFL